MEELDIEEWQCAICFELLCKPSVNVCGHAFCFWCIHRAMDPLRPSRCPMCRSTYMHLPRACNTLHTLVSALFPEETAQRLIEVAALEADINLGSCPVELLPLGNTATASEAAATGQESNAAAARADITPPADVAQPDTGCDVATASPNPFPHHPSSSSSAPGDAYSSFAQQLLSGALDLGPDKELPLLLRCAVPSCRQLLAMPVVLSCGHVVCGAGCTPGLLNTTRPSGQPAAQQQQQQGQQPPPPRQQQQSTLREPSAARVVVGGPGIPVPSAAVAAEETEAANRPRRFEPNSSDEEEWAGNEGVAGSSAVADGDHEAGTPASGMYTSSRDNEIPAAASNAAQPWASGFALGPTSNSSSSTVSTLGFELAASTAQNQARQAAAQPSHTFALGPALTSSSSSSGGGGSLGFEPAASAAQNQARQVAAQPFQAFAAGPAPTSSSTVSSPGFELAASTAQNQARQAAAQPPQAFAVGSALTSSSSSNGRPGFELAASTAQNQARQVAAQPVPGTWPPRSRPLAVTPPGGDTVFNISAALRGAAGIRNAAGPVGAAPSGITGRGHPQGHAGSGVAAAGAEVTEATAAAGGGGRGGGGAAAGATSTAAAGAEDTAAAAQGVDPEAPSIDYLLGTVEEYDGPPEGAFHWHLVQQNLQGLLARTAAAVGLSLSDLLQPAGEEVAQQWCCPVCQVPVGAAQPEVCRLLHELLMQYMPTKYRQRLREVCEAREAQKQQQQQQQQQGAADAGDAEEMGPDGEQEDQVGAADQEASESSPQVTGALQPTAPQQTPRSAPPDYMVDQLRQLQAAPPVVHMWHGVGCDGCGSYPLLGRRYKCIDCPEAVGFDLCGPCFDQGVAVSGRFGQHHMPQHRVEQQQQASRAELLLRSLVFG